MPLISDNQHILNSMSKPVYCKICGKPVLPYPVSRDGSHNNYVQFEMQNQIHLDCWQKEKSKERRRNQ